MKTMSKFVGLVPLLLSMFEGAAFAQSYTQTNLVANTPGVAQITDPQLSGPIGLARASGDEWWVSDATSGLSTLYIGTGVKQTLVVTIPPADANNPSTPTGTPSGIIANNSTTDFLLAPGMPAHFVFSTLDGSIAAWNPAVGIAQGAAAPSTHAITVATRTDGSRYTGLTSAFLDGKRYLYAANFARNRIDVYDTTFRAINLHKDDSGKYRFDDSRFYSNNEPFVDDRLPAGYSPYNVQTIGNDVIVTYAFHPNPKTPFETDGPGLGYVDVYSSSGILLERLEHGDFMNAPWGVALAPLDFGLFSHDLLVVQAGTDNSDSSGVIAAFDIATGKFDGLLQNSIGTPLVVKGIRGIASGNVAPKNYDPAGAPATELYFTAFSNQGAPAAALFGYLTPVAKDLIEGNDQ